MRTLSLLVLGTTVALAAPSKADRCSLIRHNNNYDDEKFVTALPLVNPIGVYNGVKYDNFAGVDTQTASADLNILEPPSKPNVLVTGFEQQLLKNGSISNGIASMTTVFNDAPRPYMNVHDLNLACFANDAASGINVPIICDVTMRSYVNGTMKGEQKIHYDPHLRTDPKVSRVPPLVANLTRFYLEDPNFCDIDTLTLVVEGGATNLKETLGSVKDIETVKGIKNLRRGNYENDELPLPKLLVAAAIDNVNVTLHC